MRIVQVVFIILLLLFVPEVVNSNGYSISTDPNEDVLAIDTTESRLSILTRSRMYLYNTQVSINESVRYEGISTLYKRIQENIELLELKLLSDHEVAYCTAATCGYCKISDEKSYCNSLSWQFLNENFDQQLSSASIASIHRKLVLRLVDKSDNAATLLFDIDNESGNFTKISVQSDTDDVPHISDQISVAGFSRGSCVYFVGTYLQNIHHFQWTDAYNSDIAPYEHNTTLIKLTRSCFNASTSQIVSTTELNVNCMYYNSNPLEKVYHARYDPKKEELWLLSRKAKYLGKATATLCPFNMKHVDERFDHETTQCQRRSIYKKNENLRIFHNCNSKDYSQMHWPADYNLFKGNRYDWWWPPYHSFADLLIDPTHGDVFYSNNAKAEGHLRVSRRNSRNYEHDLTAILVIPINSHVQRQAIGISNDYLFYINKNSVVFTSMSCDAFYATCESIPKDTSICAWCADEGHQRAFRISDRSYSCQRPLFRTCPAVHESEHSPAAPSQATEITSNVMEQTKVTILKSLSEAGERESNYVILSVLFGVLLMLVTMIGLIMLQQANVSRLYRYNNERPKYLWQNARPLLTSDTYDEEITPHAIISLLTSSSLQTKYDYAHLFKNIDDAIKIDLSCLQLIETIGEGNFGVVYSGSYTTPDGDIIKVACKMLRDGDAGVRAFFDEGLTMMKFNHDRVIPFIGIALANDSDPIIVTKFMPNGNLLTYLRNNSNTITVDQILDFSIQIAEGMEYLHSKKFIHRDLAARNCMLDFKMQLKIGDFGLARQCNNQNIYLSCNYPDMPFAWSSIEALEFWTFTLKGDIWSYGVVLWELMSRGAKPYPKYNPDGLLKFLKDGERLRKPLECPEEFYTSIMMPCWYEDMNKRPSFIDLIVQLNEFAGNSNIHNE